MTGSTLILLLAVLGQAAAGQAQAQPADDVGQTGSSQLLVFTATWCPACRQVAPEVQTLKARGYPVKIVDVDREKVLARKYQVTTIPCFIAVDKTGKELDRMLGYHTAREIGEFYNAAINRDRLEHPLPPSPPTPASPLLTGVVMEKMPHMAAGQTWTGGNVLPAGEPEDDNATPVAPKVFVTIIGNKRECRAVKLELTRNAEFAALQKSLGAALVVEGYDPKNPLVADVGLPAHGQPDVIVLDAGGAEIARFDRDPGPEAIAEAVRRADPNYKPGGGGGGRDRPGPEPTGPSTRLGLWWIVTALVSVYFLFRSKRGPT